MDTLLREGLCWQNVPTEVMVATMMRSRAASEKLKPDWNKLEDVIFCGNQGQ